MNRQVRVLITDDSPPSRQGLKALLALSPQVELVGEARDGQESVRLVAERQPDVVLMDVQMSIMDGMEATRHIKSQWPGVKVIVLTTYATYQTAALAAGVDAFVSKGDPPEKLLTALRTIN